MSGDLRCRLYDVDFLCPYTGMVENVFASQCSAVGMRTAKLQKTVENELIPTLTGWDGQMISCSSAQDPE